jgi:hypothetical protein
VFIVLDREALKAYQARWEAVAAVEEAERGQATLAERWREMNAILRMAIALGLKLEEDEVEIAAVHRRWNRLRDIYETRAPSP